ncbi:ABC transporter substrate-binding protein [Patescibacteria group bacterium]
MPSKVCSNINKNKLATLFFVFSLPLFITACTLTETLSGLPLIGKFFDGGGNGPVRTGPADLTVWTLWEHPDVLNVLAQRFSEQNSSVTINFDDRSVIKPIVDYKERAYLRAEDPAGPDIMRVHVSWLPTLVSSLVPMPEKMMDAQTFSNSFYPSATKSLVYDGKIYGLPSYYDGLVLVYNKDHFEEVGQLEAPTAWEEFRRLALELTIRSENEEIIRGGAAMGTADNIDFFSDIVGMLFEQAQVPLPGELDGQAAQDALSFYVNFVEEDGVWSSNLPEASAAFAQEKVSMIFIPTWNLLDIIAARPDMNIGVAPVPQALPDEPASWASYWVDVVPKSSDAPEASWAFLHFLAQEEQQLLAYSEASKFRRFGAPYSLVSLKPELDSNPYVNPLLESAPYGKTNSFANRAGNRKQVESLRSAIGSLTSGDNYSSVEDILRAMKTELEN